MISKILRALIFADTYDRIFFEQFLQGNGHEKEVEVRLKKYEELL